MKLILNDGRPYPLQKNQISIGRAPVNDIQITEDLASGQHATLYREGHTYAITDHNSTNGTYVNEQRVQGSYLLQSGDVIRIGRTTLRVVAEAQTAPTAVDMHRAPNYAPQAPPPPPPPPPQQQPAYYQQPVYPPPAYPPPPGYAGRPPSPQTEGAATVALWLEIVFGIFGLLGVGHVYTGRIGLGILAMIAWWIYIGISWTITGITFGLFSCLAIPLYIAIPIISGVQARSYMRQRGGSGSWGSVGLVAGCGCLLVIAATVGLFLALGGLAILAETM